MTWISLNEHRKLVLLNHSMYYPNRTTKKSYENLHPKDWDIQLDLIEEDGAICWYEYVETNGNIAIEFLSAEIKKDSDKVLINVDMCFD